MGKFGKACHHSSRNPTGLQVTLGSEKFGDMYAFGGPGRPASAATRTARSSWLPQMTDAGSGALMFRLHPRYRADSDKTPGPPATRGGVALRCLHFWRRGASVCSFRAPVRACIIIRPSAQILLLGRRPTPISTSRLRLDCLSHPTVPFPRPSI